MPDFEAIHGELIRHKHLTLELLWQEYKDQLRSPQNAGTTSRARSCPLATAHEVEPRVESADTGATADPASEKLRQECFCGNHDGAPWLGETIGIDKVGVDHDLKRKRCSDLVLIILQVPFAEIVKRSETTVGSGNRDAKYAGCLAIDELCRPRRALAWPGCHR